MKVRELIAELQKFDPEDDVYTLEPPYTTYGVGAVYTDVPGSVVIS